MRILITGAGGQVGRELVEHCEAAGDEVMAPDHETLDVTDREAVLGAILSSQPHAVVHTAAWTAVDACEDDPGRALLHNGLAVRHVAEACRRSGAHLVHLSTDYVFDGSKPAPYDEWDTPNPASVYGRSKWAGEQELTLTPDATCVRISWVCGRFGNNMVKTAMRLAAGGVDPRFVDDQVGHPTVVADLVPVLRRLAVDRRPGLFHVTNQGPVSWFDFVRAVFEAAGADPERVTPIATAELDPPRPAPRPANSVLANRALALSGLDLLPDFRDSLDRLVAGLLAAAG
jgi:dTDP-4-dehydrorhamnose reductase